MKIIAGVVSTLLTLGVIGTFADPPAAVQAPQAPGQLSPEQLEAIQRTVSAMNPGSKVKVEVVHTDGGTLLTTEEGTGKGASASAEGDKLNEKITGDAPVVNRGADGSAQAKGGDVERKVEATAPKLPSIAWNNPLFWIGVALLGGAGFGVYSSMRRLALCLGVAGAGCLAVSFYPALLIWGVAALVLVLAGPYVYAEILKLRADKSKAQAEQKAESSHEALRAVVAGVEHSTVSPDAQKAVKLAIGLEADGADREVIQQVKMADKIGKFAD